MANKIKRQQVLFEYLVAQQATQRVDAANKHIEDGFTRMQKAIQRGGVAGAQELKKLEKESREALKDINALRSGVAKLDKAGAKAFDAQIDSLKDFQKQIKLAQGDVRDFDEEFSEASRRVALAGDVETGARTLGGTVGAFGGAGGRQIETGVAVISEIPASLEAIGRLKPALAGLPDVLKSVASSLGKTGLGLGAVAIGAAIAFSVLSKRANEARKRIEQFTEQLAEQAKTAANLQQALDADDFEAAAQQIKQAQTDVINAELELANLEADRAKLLSQLTVDNFTLAETLVDLDEKVETAANELETLTGNYDKQVEVLGDYDLTLEEVEAALTETNEAEKEHISLLLQSAEATRARFLSEQALLDQSTEQLQGRLEAIDNERKATELAIQELEGSGQATEEITDRLEQYRSTLERLGQEQEFINNQALMTAQVREQEAEATERLRESEEDRLKQQEEFNAQAEKALQERADLEKKFADDLVSISERAAEESEKALDGLNKKLGDLNRQLQTDIANQQIKNDRKLLEAQTKAQRAERDEFVKHRRTLLDIQQDADDQELDLQQARDFRGVFNLRRSTRKRIQTEQKDMQRRLNDQAIERARNRTDMLKAFQDERNDRMRKFQQDINDANRQFTHERLLAQQNAINAINIRRQQFSQEQSDLMMASSAYLGLRQQTLRAELALLQGFGSSAASMLGQLQNQQAQVASPVNAIAAFGAGALGAGTGQTTTNNNTTGNITVNAAPQQSGMEIARSNRRMLQRIAQ